MHGDHSVHASSYFYSAPSGPLSIMYYYNNTADSSDSSHLLSVLPFPAIVLLTPLHADFFEAWLLLEWLCYNCLCRFLLCGGRIFCTNFIAPITLVVSSAVSSDGSHSSSLLLFPAIVHTCRQFCRFGDS